MASKSISQLTRSWPQCICKLARSRPPSAFLNSLDLGLQVYLQISSNVTRKRISKLAQIWSPNLHIHGLQVPLQTFIIMASKSIRAERSRVYGDAGVMQVDRVTGSILSADPGADRDHLISITSYYTMKIHTLLWPTFGLTCTAWDFLDPRNCVDPQCGVVSYLLTWFLLSSIPNCSFSWIQLGCHKRSGGVLMVASLPSGSIVSPQWPPTGASLSSLSGSVQVLLELCSTTICCQIDHLYIYRKT